MGEWINASGLKKHKNDLKGVLAKRGAFHVGCTAAYLWKGDDRWDEPRDVLANRIKILTDDPGSLDSTITEAFDLDRALKSYVFDERLNKELHSRKSSKALGSLK